MNIKRAIHTARHNLCVEVGIANAVKRTGANNKWLEFWRIVLQALERAEPKEPQDIAGEFGDTTLCCPSCQKPVINYWNKRVNPPNCMMCGQALKWNDGSDNIGKD